MATGRRGRAAGGGGKGIQRERVSRFACLLLVQSLRKVIENVNGRDTRTSGKCLWICPASIQSATKGGVLWKGGGARAKG